MAFVLKRTAIIATVLALIVALAGWYSHQTTQESVRQALLGEATLLAEHAARSLEGIDLTLQTTVQEVEASWRAGQAPSLAVQSFLDRRADGLPQVIGFMITDREGRVIADHGEQPATSVADRAFFLSHREAFEPGRLFLGEPLRSGANGRSFFTASYAVRGQDGGFGGVVVAVFDPFYYRRYYQGFEPRLSARDVALIDDDGVILASSSDFAMAVGVPLGADTFERAYKPEIVGGEIMRITLPASGESHLAVMIGVPGYAFYGYVGLSEGVALREWTQLMIGMILALVLAILGAAAGAYGIWRREDARRQAFDAMEHAHRDAREARDRAEAASAAKSRFLAHISHELRTPLNAILGFSEVIRDGILGENPARHREYAKLIHKSGRHLLQIINDLLDLSRIEAGRWEVKVDEVDVGNLFESAELLTRQDFSDRGIRLARDLPADCPPLYADERAARQMLVNLLSNAAKFSSQGEAVELRAAPRVGGGYALTVSDRGPGIPAERLGSLFEPFSQARGLTSYEGHGTGLGLPLVKSLMDMHGGEVRIDSREDEGTAVTLTFPPLEHLVERRAEPAGRQRTVA